MSILTDDSLEFARKHIEKFYDSDFFPKLFEFKAIWHSWEEVKKELMSKNIGKMVVSTPILMTSKKPKKNFRVVQQLDPIDTLVYTALTYLVAESIEKARVSKLNKVACSYRIELNEGNFFSESNGFVDFIEKSEELSNQFDYVLATDISDFYSQIYLHRLNNNIEYSNPALKEYPNELESFLSKLNHKNSQGLPVGPAPSIVLAEALLIDIDEFLVNAGFDFTRYVDDFRIFGKSEKELLEILDKFTLYLFKNHRLTLSSDKTKIVKTSLFIDEILHNHYEIEKSQIFEKLRVIDPYDGEVYIEEDFEMITDFDTSTKEEQEIKVLMQKLLEREILDLGIARALIRKSKKLKLKSICRVIFERFDFFIPVVNDVFLYFQYITDDEFIQMYRDEIINLSKSDCLNNLLVKYWFEWYISNNLKLLQILELRRYINNNASVVFQSQAAINLNQVSWIRNKKDSISNAGDWDRRAIIYSAQILPSDERNNWLKYIESNSNRFIDKIVAKWVREAFN